MPTAAHTFARSNFDDADEARPSSDFRQAVNIHLAPGQVYPATGNVAMPVSLPIPPVGITLSLGLIEDEATDTAVVFYYNSAGRHRLVRYTPAGAGGAGTETLILEWAGLNLAPELVLQGRVIGGILVYLDASGEPRAVPLARTEAGTFTPAYLAAEPFALHLVKVPPSAQPTAVRDTTTGADSRESLRIIQSKAYQFSYRWHYVDGEPTPQAPYSDWLDILGDPSTSTFNSILITLPGPVPAGVVTVDVLVREAATNIWQIADTLRRDASGVLPATFRFYGQVIGGALTEAETAKQFEACWPCEALEIATSRVFEANTLEGYPTPEPKFTAEVYAGNAGTTTKHIYHLHQEGFEPGQPSQNGEPVPDVVVEYDNYFILSSGTYPDPGSTYLGVSPINGTMPTRYKPTGATLTYDEAFTNNVLPNETYREISELDGEFSEGDDQTTFHERSAYRVTTQFYDALGRPYGCGKPVTVYIPSREPGNTTYQSIEAVLTTTGAAALNAEIPAGAYSYCFLVARNERTPFFLQGTAADVLGYLGHKTIRNDTNGGVDEIEQVVDVIHTAHEKVLVDIGNFPPAGIGYNFQRGDLILFRNENKIFPILDKRGDYLEIAWTGYPDKSVDAQGRTMPPIEIYSPNTTNSTLYYERGPRMRVLRTGTGAAEQRSYSQTRVVLPGDCFLVPLNIPIIKRDAPDADYGSTYLPPDKKEFTAAPAATLVESMVPPYRLAPVKTTTTIVHERQQKGIYDGFFGIKNQESVTVSTGSFEEANLTNRAADALLWLDVSWGGRGFAIVPKELQQVRRNIIRHSNPKQNGNLINGLGSFEPLSFYDRLPQELGPVVRMSVADQAQADGSVLFVNQAQGETSLYLGQQPIQADANTQLLSITDKVIGGGNTLRGGYGCTDANTVERYAGMVFFYSRERRELMRYNKSLSALGEENKCRTRLAEMAARYGDGRITGCFDANRQEYLLTYHGNDEVPGVTLVWSERRKAWADQLPFVPTAGGSVNAELVTWQLAALHRHLPTAPVGTFFGTYTPPSITFVAASPFAKTWQALAVRSQAAWLPTELTTPAGQASRILRLWMRFIQGVWRAAIRRDVNSLRDPIKALHNGRVLQSESLSVTLTCPQDFSAPLVGASVDYLVNTGQQPNQ